MIETERQQQAALGWIRYWKESVFAGGQSWLDQEEAPDARMRLRKGIDEYEKQVRMSGSVSKE